MYSLYSIGCGKTWKEVEDYYALRRDIDKSVEILDNNEDVIIKGKILNITPVGVKIMGELPWKTVNTIPHAEVGGRS